MKGRGLVLPVMVVLLGADAVREPEIPELNRKVLAFAQDKLGKKVGDGECATLAVQALRAAGARPWAISERGEYIWGKRVRTITPGKDPAGDVLPGDILQFQDAFFRGHVGRTTFEYAYPMHTAIVAAVKQDGKVVEILHQNAGDLKARDEDRRKVQRFTLRFAELKKGTITVYRPLPANAGKE